MKYTTRIAFHYAVCAACLLSGRAAALTPTATFVPLGHLPAAASQETYANAISGDGSTVVGVGVDSLARRVAFRWSATTGMTAIGDLPGGDFASEARGVSFDGSVIVGSSSSTRSYSGHPFYHEPFRWTATDGITALGYLSTNTWAYGSAYDVSADGATVVGNSTDQQGFERPFRWTEAAGMTSLGHLPSSFSNQNAAFAISQDGQTVVGFSTSVNGREAFRWTQATGINSLGWLPGGATPGNIYSAAFDVSADGSTIVGASYSTNGIEAFRWTAAAGITGLGDLPLGYFISDALAVSADGRIIVGQAYNAQSGVAAIWQNGSPPRDLRSVLISHGLGPQLAGWQLNVAIDISADGRTIVGHGYGPRGPESWVATLPVPEPAAAILLTSALLATSRLLRGRRSPGRT
jgi:probable HAF family extracellular repeat protein